MESTPQVDPTKEKAPQDGEKNKDEDKKSETEEDSAYLQPNWD